MALVINRSQRSAGDAAPKSRESERVESPPATATLVNPSFEPKDYKDAALRFGVVNPGAKRALPQGEITKDSLTFKPFNPGPGDQRAFEAGGTVAKVWRPVGTGYYPHSSRMQGGYVDRRDHQLYTLQQFLANPEKVPYVSVAMDTAVSKYGQLVHIPELDARHRETLKKHGIEHIPFRIVDTGGRFEGRGTGKIDICTSSKGNTQDEAINQRLTVQVINERGRSPNWQLETIASRRAAASSSIADTGKRPREINAARRI